MHLNGLKAKKNNTINVYLLRTLHIIQNMIFIYWGIYIIQIIYVKFILKYFGQLPSTTKQTPIFAGQRICDYTKPSKP